MTRLPAFRRPQLPSPHSPGTCGCGGPKHARLNCPWCWCAEGPALPRGESYLPKVEPIGHPPVTVGPEVPLRGHRSDSEPPAPVGGGKEMPPENGAQRRGAGGGAQ